MWIGSLFSNSLAMIIIMMMIIVESISFFLLKKNMVVVTQIPILIDNDDTLCVSQAREKEQ